MSVVNESLPAVKLCSFSAKTYLIETDLESVDHGHFFCARGRIDPMRFSSRTMPLTKLVHSSKKVNHSGAPLV